nr:TolC family protein [Bacteroidota bacterium]
MDFLRSMLKFLAFMFLPVGLFAQNSDTLTLDFCHNRAVEVYPLVKQKILNKEASGIRNENFDKNYLPQFEVNGRASYQSEVTQVPINMPGISIPVPDKDMYDLYVGVNQLIWDGGITREQKNLEEADLQINQQQVEVELYKIKERVNGLFYRILLYKTSRELLLINRQTVTEKMQEFESGIRNGVVLQSAADVLKVQILAIDQGVTEIDANMTGAFKMLGELMELQIPVTAILILPDPSVETDTYINLRPEYRLLELQKHKLDLSKNMISASYLPKFSAFGKAGYGKPALNMLSNEFDTYYYVGVGLSWDIVNWNKQINQKKLLDVQQGIVETQREAFNKNVKIQVEDDMAEINKYSELISKDQEIIDLREKISHTSSSQLDNGMITSTQYLDELNKETQARLDKEMHRIQLSLAKINYLKTIGKL